MRNTLVFLAVIALAISRITAQPDVGVKSFTIKIPATLTTAVCDADTAYTFDIVVCEVGGTDATVTAVNLYYTDGDDYATASTIGSANAATLGDSASDISVSANGESTNTGAIVTINTDGACASYTHICAVTTTTSDNTPANDNACIALAGGTTSTTNCPVADCDDPGTVENAQKQGDTFAHGDTVTYTCNANYHLVGEETLTCNDGEWDNEVPMCSDTAPTMGSAATTEIQPTTAESRSETNVDGLYYSLIATLAFIGMAYF
ncbi:inactive serine protease PAMR1-like [Ptychodera flava]|uniref:inactive serine protease PAMR1-like n=1 Tax=Ptychodera flava TaxID=63121 RepID=UPI003969E896